MVWDERLLGGLSTYGLDKLLEVRRYKGFKFEVRSKDASKNKHSRCIGLSMNGHEIVGELPREVSLVPGGHLFVLSRDVLTGIGLRRLGLEIRDTLLVLGIEGLSFAFLCRKPLEGTVAENVLRHGQGGLWIDGCRLSTGESPSVKRREAAAKSGKAGHLTSGICGEEAKRLGRMRANRDPLVSITHYVAVRAGESLGRWPTNLVLIHTPECRKAGTEQIPAWVCQEGCSVLALDRQSGTLTSGAGAIRQKTHQTTSMAGSLGGPRGVEEVCYGDEGGASRFYPQFASQVEFMDWLVRLLKGVE